MPLAGAPGAGYFTTFQLFIVLEEKEQGIETPQAQEPQQEQTPQEPQQEQEAPKKHRSLLGKIWRVTRITLVSLLLLVAVLIVLIYMPFVQDMLVPKVLDMINSDEMTVKVERFRLRFPLDVNVRGLEVYQKGDTMLMAGEANVDVKMLPLISGKVDVSKVDLADVYYKSGTPDSVTYIRARVNSAELMNANVALKKQSVDLDNLVLRGGNIKVALRNDTTPPTPPSAPVEWSIAGRKITLADIDFQLTMPETGDSIGVRLDNFTLANGSIDLGKSAVNVADVLINGIDARYITGTLTPPEQPEAVPADTVAADSASVPFTININHLLLDKGKVLYATAGAVPQPGLDMQYIDVTSLTVEVDSLYNSGANMRVPLRRLNATERSGLQLNGTGLFEMNSSEIDVRDFALRTLASTIDVNATYGLTPADAAPLSVNLKAEIDPIDVTTAFPDLAATVDMLPKYRKIGVDVDLAGTLADLRLEEAEVSMRNYFDVKLSGQVADVTDFDHASGHIDIDGNFEDINFLKPALMDAKMRRTTHLPSLRLAGEVNMDNGVIDGDLRALTRAGKLALDAKWNSRIEGYDVKVNADKFPVGTFLPGMGIENVTAKIEARGRGLNPMSSRTSMYAAVDAIDVGYRGNSIHDFKVTAKLGDGNADLSVTSANELINGHLNASGNLAGKTYDWTMSGDFADIDLYRLGVTDTVSTVSTSFGGNLKMTPTTHDIDAQLNISSVDARMGETHIAARDFNIGFLGTDSSSVANIDNEDMKIRFASPMLIDSVAQRFSSAMAMVGPMVEVRDINVDSLHKVLPVFTLTADAGQRNAVHDFLAASGTSFEHASLSASNDSIIRIYAVVDKLVTGSTRLDRLEFDANQQGNLLEYNLKVDNEPGTMDDFAHIAGKGYIGGDKVMMQLTQSNISDATGYKIGALVELSDSMLTLRLDPVDPVIGYKQWHVNPDNFISLNTRSYHIDANLLMENNDSRLRIYTEHDSEHGDDGHQESLNVDISEIQIADWISLSPYAPPMRGLLSANIALSMAPGELNGEGTVTLADFTYNKKRVGTLDLSLDVTTSRSGAITANTGLQIDGREVMRANGALNDSTQREPFLLDFALTRFPLEIANPFLTGTATLAGYLSGDMDVTGSMAEPKFNGYLDFDSATAKVTMLGTTFEFSEEKIPVDSNVIRFDKYAIYGVNDNPLEIDGNIDMRSLSNISLDLKLSADNMQVVGAEKRGGSDVYGKAFISLDATARGNLNFINARAKITVKEGTNVTYVIPDASSQIESQSTGDMVHFVNFSDTTAINREDSVIQSGTMMNLTALLTVEQGTVLGVDLSATGQDRVQLVPNGTIDFTMNPLGDTGATGRLNITGGYVRYSPPLISEKMFDFREGSYVALNGDISDPIIHITAVDVIKANVTAEGQNSRLVNFDVILKVDGSLNNMNVAFDLETDEDLTVRNELQSMSPEQRANQAMNLLLYSVYTGPGTKGSANLSGNPLYSFLSSQLNSWMANNVKGVDISFGVDQYERTLDGSQSTTTSYSYKVSKSFLDDRIKVIVGGNYSTDADANENLSQNLINDISIEYLLNKSGTMYVRLFRHTGYESILEGEVTQTGVGFVYKRKLRTLRNLFRKGRVPKNQLPQEGAVRVAGDVLRKLRKTDAANSDKGKNDDKQSNQPLNVKEDEKVSD